MGFDSSEYQERLKRLYRMLVEKQADLAILSQNADIYYYSGSAAPLYLAVPAEGEPFLLARKAVERIAGDAPQLKLEIFNGSKDLKAIFERRGLNAAKRIGLTLDTIAYASVQRLLELSPGSGPVDLSWEIRALRMVKSAAEIAIQAKAGTIMGGIAELVRTCFKPGITEIELSALIEGFMRIQGHAGLVRCRREGIEIGLGVCSAGRNSLAGTKFDGVCAGAGISAAAPYGSGFKRIGPGEPVTLDYAFNLDGYLVDQTRMLIWGEPAAEVTVAYQAMVKIQQAVFEVMKPGTGWSEAYDLAVNLAREFGYEREFMGLGPEKVRFVGHGIGLELDEPPFVAANQKLCFEAGMVVAIEPKVALPGIGVVGIEDTVVVRPTGVERLTKCPSELILV
jgi:Xaa-Pro dipeptidase